MYCSVEWSLKDTLMIQAISIFSPRCLTSEMTEIGVTRSNRSEAARYDRVNRWLNYYADIG